MNVSSLRFGHARVSKPLRIFLFSVLALTAANRAPADENQAMVNDAVAAAQSWLAQIDAGKYEESYDEGCLAFHNKVSELQWTTILKSLRPPLGTVVSRKVVKTEYKPDGLEGLQGECMVITYNTAFSRVPVDLEIVVLQREDGHWRGAGYNAQPQGDPTEPDSMPPPEVHTEINQEPVK
jgi:hypothetical protein